MASEIDPQRGHLLAALTAKHLPPSASRLRLWDVGGRLAGGLAALRDDLEISTPADLTPEVAADVADAVVALNHPIALNAAFLAAALRVLRAGGRLTLVDTSATPGKDLVRLLEETGYTRILVEAVEGGGVLMRGEVPHTTGSTFARIRVAADADADNISLAAFDGPYVFVLVQQMPNKPVWKLAEGEVIRWNALAALRDGVRVRVGFTSLPKAVGLMQPAVLQGVVRDVNKVAKFSRETAASWGEPVMLNPTLAALKALDLTTISLDPASAEAPDE